LFLTARRVREQVCQRETDANWYGEGWPSDTERGAAFVEAGRAIPQKALAVRQATPEVKAARQRSGLEARFAIMWRSLGGPRLQEEVLFAPPRKWRFDFAIEQGTFYAVDGPVPPGKLIPGIVVPNMRVIQNAVKIAIEIEGGIWSGGRHTRGKGFESDVEKYNTATLLGWRVFRLTGSMLTERHLKPIIDLCK